jgi:hypothetical protein
MRTPLPVAVAVLTLSVTACGDLLAQVDSQTHVYRVVDEDSQLRLHVFRPASAEVIASTATVGCPSVGSRERPIPDVLLLWSPALNVSADRWFIRQLQGKADAEAVSPAQHVHAATPPTSIVHLFKAS